MKFPERRLKYFKMLKAGQYWKHLPKEVQYEAMGDKLNLGGGKTGFFRRIDWDTPAPTLVTDPTMPATDLCHPEKDRPLSIQEYARIQEFPDDWKFTGSIAEQYKQIGNAVPVGLAEALGKAVIATAEASAVVQTKRFRGTNIHKKIAEVMGMGGSVNGN